MAVQRLPLTVNLDADDYSQGAITSGAGTTNVLYSQSNGNKTYASQRPAIQINSDPTDEDGGVFGSGRGIAYWDVVDNYYIVRDNTVYRGDYTNPIATISSGRERVYFVEINDYLVLIDTENNEGWYIHADTIETVTEITDSNFPGNLDNKELAGGAVSLDGYLFLMTTDGFVYNSNLNDPTTWSALDFISTDISSDGGVFIAKHHNHICAIGQNSTEFFYDAGNPVGSPLQLRQDVSYLTGALDREAVATVGDDILFLGRSSKGTIRLYRMNGFKLLPASGDNVDRFINDTYNTRARNTNTYFKFVLSGAWFGEHLLTFVTSVERDNTGYNALYTLVYDASKEVWTTFNTELTQVEAFSVIDSTESSGTSNVRGSLLFTSGAIATVQMTRIPIDSRASSGYVEDGYIEDGYFVAADPTVYRNVHMTIVTPETDFDMSTLKNCHRLSVVGTTTSPSEDLLPIEVSWSDDRYRTFTNPRDLDTGFNRSLTRCGNFRRRSHKIFYEGEDFLKLEQLEIDVRASQYA